jgi:hypothetical protein
MGAEEHASGTAPAAWRAFVQQEACHASASAAEPAPSTTHAPLFHRGSIQNSTPPWRVAHRSSNARSVWLPSGIAFGGTRERCRGHVQPAWRQHVLRARMRRRVRSAAHPLTSTAPWKMPPRPNVSRVKRFRVLMASFACEFGVLVMSYTAPSRSARTPLVSTAAGRVRARARELSAANDAAAGAGAPRSQQNRREARRGQRAAPTAAAAPRSAAGCAAPASSTASGVRRGHGRAHAQQPRRQQKSGSSTRPPLLRANPAGPGLDSSARARTLTSNLASGGSAPLMLTSAILWHALWRRVVALRRVPV